MNTHLESITPSELPGGMQQGILLPGDEESNWENTPRSILRSTSGALSDGRISEAVAQFDWSDYYDHISSRRTALSAFFTEWIEY